MSADQRADGPSGGSAGLLPQLTKRLVERALDVELAEHLGYERGRRVRGDDGNARNGTTPKTIETTHGPVRIDTPRDRYGTFQPQIVRKRQRRFAGSDANVIALYADGTSLRDIHAHLAEIYGATVAQGLISRVADAIVEDARAWRHRGASDGGDPARPPRR